MGCILSEIGDNPKLFDRLMKLTNNDNLKSIEYLATITSPEFADWYKANVGSELDITNMSKVSPTLLQLSRKFTNVDNFSVDNTIQRYDSSRTGVFGNDLLKEDHAVNILATLFLKGERALINSKKTITSKVVKATILKQLIEHKSKNKESLTSEQVEFVDTLIKNIYDNNKFENNSLFSLVIRHPNVNALSKSLGLFKENDSLTNEDETFDENGDPTDQESIETLKADWSNIADEKPNYDKNISKEVKELFATTGETISNETIDGNYNYNSATYSGIAETISFADYYKTIMTNAVFDNADAFVDSLFDIAARFPNRSALKIIAEKLVGTDLKAVNLKNKLYSQFNQANTERNELQYSAGNVKVRLRNRGSNPRIVLYDKAIAAFNNLMNSPVNVNTNSNILAELELRWDQSKSLEGDALSESLLNIQNHIVNIFNSFNVGVTEEGIYNYIKYEQSGNTSRNIKNLIDIANAFNSSLIGTIPSVIANNKAKADFFIKESLIQKEAEERGETYIIKQIPYENLTDVSNSGNSVANLIAAAFAPYQLVNLEFNSLNVDNNLVSDILKPNMLKRFFDRMKNPELALEFFNNLALLEQYRNSNILFEQRDKSGNILIPGVLRKVNDKNELTEYYNFMTYQLFNGARNEVTNAVKGYANMTKSEWDITALNEFHNNGEVNFVQKFKLSKYFIQTPSDAPKTFTITGYRLSIDGLYSDGINRNHAIYKALENTMMQEYNRAAQALVFMFETTEDDNGNVRLKRTKSLKPKAILKEEFRVEDLSNTRLNTNYHYSRGSIFNSKGELTGNIFKSRALTIDESDSADTNPNNIANEGGGKISDYLYGGSGQEQSIDIVRNADGQIVASLNESQKEAVRKYIDNYLQVRRDGAATYYADYINHVQGFNGKIEGLTKEEQAAQNTASRAEYNNFVTEFALNYTIQYINFNELYFGDTAYYKNSQDTIKRNKQVQAGGLLNGGYELNDSVDKEVARLTVANREIVINSTFKYITLKDVSRPGADLASIGKQLDAANTPDSTRVFILNNFASNVDVTDAQSFITLDEFVRRIVLTGEYDNYKDTIEALYDESKPIDFTKLSKLIQVQKNFYYGLDTDTSTGIRTPIQIKNAEFVMIPRFLGNSELALLNESMVNNGISQANFISTEKTTTNRVLSFWQTDGSLTNETLDTFNSQLIASTKTGWYANLYKQQDVPQHMDDVNKAGLQIVKKMLDNISNTEKGRELIDKFFKNFNANIADSFNELADRIGVKYVDGEVQYLNGEPIVDIEEFYNIIRDELTSRGVDSNLMSYATLENGEPLMPTYVNNVRTKLESVIQSLFTNNITKQKIPGFHASQITSVGMKRLNPDIKSETFNQSNFEEANGYKLGRELQYRPNGENYMEVILPQHMKKMYNRYNADGTLEYEITIKDLQDAGLDYMIGYRMPTEGKQSVVKIKVIGFLNESQGSTIIVPDGFISQTGSDFDIDSIYGMYHNVRFDETGKPHKIKFLDDSNSTVEDRYYNYVKRNLSREEKSKMFEESRLDEDEKDDLKKKVRNDIYEKYGYQISKEVLSEAIRGAMSNEYRSNVNAALDYAAEQLNLKSLEDFSKQSIELQNTREARDNQIVDTFLEIMDMEESWEENLMSSNFKDIKAAKEAIFGKEDIYRNINTFEAQSEYRHIVMDGAILKGVSVKSDNFVSIAGLSKATIQSKDGGFKFAYPVPTDETVESFYSRMVATFGNDAVRLLEDRVIVDHKSIGWSLDNNRNMEDKFISVYSSETTALILDGVKEGGVPGVDGYTFDVYKAIASVGSNFETSILFVNQPAVRLANEIYQRSENIFEARNENAIFSAKMELYEKLLIVKGFKVKKFTSFEDITSSLKVAGIEIDSNIGTFDIVEMKKYINDDISTEDAILYQIEVLKAFEHYKNITNQMDNHYNVLNVDKVGAGQSVNESDRLISNIEDIAKHNDSSIISGRPMLTSDITDISLLDSIYPKRSFDDINALMKDDSQSVYPSLYQQLKYGVIAASAISGTLFKTHSPEFKQLKHFLGSKDLTTIKEFENHIISLAMNKSKMVTSNTYAVRDNKNKDNNYLIDVSAPSDYENRSRLFGFGQELVNEFDFKDLSEDNVRRFMLLTPANKVMLLQSSTKTDDLFKRLNVSIQDSRLVSAGRQSPQKINIIDSGIGYEQMYQLFKNAYNNDNPFVKLAAIDVVRYSIVVEGYKFKGGSVSKLVPTEILYGKRTKSRDGISYDSTNGVSNGSGIISDTNRALNDYLASVKHMDYQSLDTLLENFYRSYTKSKDIPKFENKKGKYQAIRFALNGATFIEESIASSKRLIKRNTNGMPEYHRYVMTNRPGSKRMELFKLSAASNGVYLYPINELEANEIGEVSVNPDNRAVPESSTFKSIIEANMSADNDVYIPNLTALEKAKYNITRDFVQLSNMDENYTDYGDSKVIDLWLSTTKDVNIINGIEDLNIDRTKRSIIVARDRATAVVVISELEKSKYSNYLVIAKDDSMNDIRDRLNVLNREELKAIKESQNHLKLTSRKANLVTKGPDGKDSGSFRQFKTLIDEMSTDAINTGVTFTAVMPELVRRLSFAPATHYTINRGGVDFVVTNIGEVNKRNMPMIPEYNQSLIVTTTRGQEYGFPMREVITNAVVLGSAMSFYNRATILKIQTLEHFKNEDIRESTLEETDESINQYISEVVASVARTERNTDDKSISDVARAFVNLDIRVNNSSKFNDNLREAALKVINGYTTNRSDYMFAKMVDFHKGMGINNPKLFELMITDDTLRTEYEMFIDSLSRFIEDYSSVSNIELYDIKEAELAGATAEEILDLRRTNETLKQIKSQLTKMNSLTNRVNNSIKMFFDSVIANSSTDPRIRTKLMELTDVFDDENWAQLKLANIAETHIPIVQVVLKEVMTNLRASEINARDRRISFRTEIDAIISKAKASGYNLSLNDIVDDSGKLILPYTQQFLDDLAEHKQALSIAAIEDPNGRNGVIYREARSKLENFMINNLERQYIKDFYADYAKLDNDLLKYKDSYVKLKSLMFEQSQILSTMIDNDYSTLSVEKEKRLKEIATVIAEMRNTVDENGNYKDNYYEAKAIDDYYVNRRLLEVKYKEVEPKESYVNKLKDVMEDLQSPENSETYIAAKKWLDSNTYKKLSDEFNSKLNKAFSSLRTSRVDSYLRDMTKGKYDEFGVVNGNLFNDIQISNIKSNQESKYKERSNDSRTRLIRNKQSDSNIYRSEFYENMRSAAQPAITRSTIDAINAILLPYYNSRSESLETSQISISDLNKLQTLYDTLADSGKSLTIDDQANVSLTNLKGKSDFATAKFLEDEVVFDFDMAEYERQADLALETGGITYFKEWKKVNTEVVRDSVHYKTISELGTTIASLLKVSKSRRNVNIAKSIRILEFLKPNPDAINTNNRILINSKKSTLGYYLDYLVGKTYRDSGIRTLNDIILSAKSTSPVKELLDDYRTKISTKEKDTTISDQLELLAKTGKLELSEDYKDQLARRNINSPDIFEDDWYINNHTLDDNGNIVPIPENFKFIANDETTKVQPNSRIYGTISPKNKEAWIDPEKTEAKEFVDSNVEFKNTQYYEAKYREMKAKGEVEFKQWYDANHYYDSFNNRYEPISIWREMVVKDISNYKYEPKSKWLETKVRKEFNNVNYEEGKIKTSNPKYSNDAYYNMNQYTREAYDVVSNLMNELVKDKRSRNYINKGFLPSQSIESSESKGFKDYWQDFAKSHGWYDAPINQDSVSSFNQREVNAPMLHTLSKTKLIKLRERGQDESATDFADYVKETAAQNKELQKQIIEENKQLNNPNVGERLDAFIEQMYAHNSMQESARLMKITANQLKNLKFVNRDSKGKAISDKILERISGKDQITTKDAGGTSNISKHFEAQMRKLIYNEFEKDEGTKSKVSRVLRNVVSARFMMMNVTGGIANVVYGKSQIQMERAAGTHFKYRDFLKAEMEYKDGILSYFADAYKGTTNNEVNAIIRLFDVIDLQDVREKYGNTETAFNRFENALYLQQTMGEHYMQNTTLLAMLLSHRVVKDSDGKAKVMSFETYSQSMRDAVLLDTLSKYDGVNGTNLSGEYKKTLDTIKDSTVNKEAYIRFKRDAVTDFLKSKGKALQTMFNENYKEVKASTKSEFETLPTFRSQLELKNGVATLIEGSELTNEDIAEFRGEVISLNHNIHGVYDRIGANTIQQHWAGALLMQFHKHLVPGFSKRFGYRLGHTDGIYSETRKEVSKGSYVSMAQFIATPFAKHYELNNDGELVAVRALQNIVTGYADFVSNFKTYYNILPEYDKANIRRVLSEWATIAKALLMYTAGRLLLDDDDESTQVADYVLYNADRLLSETIQYSPYGMLNETQKLYSNPIAALSTIKETQKALAAVASYAVTGDKEVLVYNSGTWYGQNKITTALWKQVPLYNQYMKHERLGVNNSYYKVRSGVLQGLVKDIIDKD